MQQDLSSPNRRFFITEEYHGIRADIFLSKSLNISRSKAQSLINNNRVFLNAAPMKKHGIPLNAKDILTLTLEHQKPSYPRNLEIPILYEDSDILILNKPANLVIHKTSAEDSQFTLVDYLKHKGFSLSNLGDPSRLGIVHRLDKHTSGALVIAKNNTAHAHLSAQIQARIMGRYYLCIINLPLKTPQIINLPIMRHPKHRLKYITTHANHPSAKSAKTAFFTLSTALDSALTTPKKEVPTLIGAKLFTGRTHQIRVHLNAINRKILGDGFYGYKGDYTGRILLHAHCLHLMHPKTQKHLELYAPLLADMQDFLRNHFSLPNSQHLESLQIPLPQIYHQHFPTP